MSASARRWQIGAGTAYVHLLDEGKELSAEGELHGEVEVLLVCEGASEPDDARVRLARERRLLGEHLRGRVWQLVGAEST